MSRLAIKDAFVVDGTGAEPLKDATVVIEDKKIVAVGKTLDVPGDAKVIDAQGKTVMPGLMDLHVHFASESVGRPIRARDWIGFTPPALKLMHALNNAKKTLEAGFTTARLMSAPLVEFVWAPSLKEATTLGIVKAPRVLAYAAVLTSGISWATIGYGLDVEAPIYLGRYAYLSPAYKPYTPNRRPVDGPWDCIKAVREAVVNGADFIKILASGAVSKPGQKHTWTAMRLEEIKAISEEAHKYEKTVSSHAHGAQAIKDSILGGVDTVEHGTFLDDECIELFKKHNAYYIPTMSIAYHIRKKADQLNFPPHVRKKVDESADLRQRLSHVKKAHRAGVKIACGTDSFGVWCPHGENALELELMVEAAGMTPMEAIVAATKVSAEAIGWQNQLGTIEKGKIADLLIVDGNPLKDIKILQDKTKIKTIIKEGKTEINRGPQKK